MQKEKCVEMEMMYNGVDIGSDVPIRSVDGTFKLKAI